MERWYDEVRRRRSLLHSYRIADAHQPYIYAWDTFPYMSGHLDEWIDVRV